ncbi:hypothetical protein BKA93DRAFT_811299 [Sparassis latifolia]|uniref:Heat shock factor-binding protein n=1 Tax=Sparassis crispa TaxID=139825 RepID=A0A401H2D3_9APHY|nr:hypothetical protein SCP_1304080 [Sparassis crispa]GBE88591.1 hypothetical protein SCP_1304080 [Sparassis crispa]
MPSSPSPALPLKVNPATPSRPGTSAGASSTAAPTPVAKAPPNPSDISSPHELTAFVETLLEELDTKFDDMSSQILDRMMQMSSRVDALEAAIHDIIHGDTMPSSPGLPQSPSAPQRRNGNATG